MKQVRASIVGATGYTGAELVRLLSSHPHVRIVSATSGRAAGERLDKHCPWLSSDLILSSFDPENTDADVVFLAQENGFAMEHAAKLIERGLKVIDLSADFRLHDMDAYRTYYKRDHSLPKPQFKVAYGLTEVTSGEEIRSADLIANPGCYPTATVLALKPLYDAGIVTGTPIIDAKSGVSGAGRSRTDTAYLFTEREGSFASYAPVGHRHTPEIEQSLGVNVRFTPHLIPVPRGMQVTAHLTLSKSITDDDISNLFAKTYADRPFVKLTAGCPETKQVLGSNRCDIAVHIDNHTGHLVVISVIDNLVKGAAGQAIQNMNLMFDYPEVTGLPVHGVWP